MAERGDPADAVAGGRRRLGGRGAPHPGTTRHDRQLGDIDTVGAAHEGHHRLDLVVAAGRVDGRHEDEVLDDLAQLDADGVGSLLGRMGRNVEGDDLDADAAFGGRITHALMGRMSRIGHGASLEHASPPAWVYALGR